MTHGVQEKRIMDEEVARGSKSLLVPTTLLESVVDVLRDNLYVDSETSPIKHEAEILSIVAKIELKLGQIKQRLEDKTFRKIPRPNNSKPLLFPPPPFQRVSYDQNDQTNHLVDVAEESSGGKGDIAPSTPIMNQPEIESKEDENLTQTLSQIDHLHDRRHSRRLSLPYLSKEDNVVSTMASTLFENFDFTDDSLLSFYD